ncbi:MAG: serine/threonine-protein kinase [Planctomycetota bacterium]
MKSLKIGDLMTDEKISRRDWVNEKCDHFEDLWLAGTPPDFRTYLSGVDGIDNQRALLVPLLELEVFYRGKQGEKIDPRSIRESFPQLAAELDRFLLNSDERSAAASIVASTETITGQSGDTSLGPNSPSTSFQVPKEIGRYRIIRTLGKGGMGIVYLAEDTKLNREVALKVPKFPEGQNEIEDRFRREAKAAARLLHRNICPVYDIATYESQLFITMAYIKGRPLSDFIKPEKLPSGFMVAQTIRRLALALQEAHDHGIVHRDLKPSNIMIDHRQEPVVMDFGLARYQMTDERQLTTSGMIIGTPTYMSPEQVRDSCNAGPAADIYSLGVIMYQMLTGQVPFSGDMISVITSIVLDEPASPSSIRKRISNRLEQICLKAIEKKPENRFASMTEFARELTVFLREQKRERESNHTQSSGSDLKAANLNVREPANSNSLSGKQKMFMGSQATWLIASAVVAMLLGGIAWVATNTQFGESGSLNEDKVRSVAVSGSQSQPIQTNSDSYERDESKLNTEHAPEREPPYEPAATIDKLIERGAVFLTRSDDTPLSVDHWRPARNLVATALLNQPKLSQSSVQAVAEMFPNLASIEIQLSTAPPDAIEALSNLKHDAIILTCNSGTEVMSTAQVEAISKINSLFQLHLQNCMLEDHHMLTIAKLRNLVCLDLRDNRVSVKGLKHLKQAPMLYELQLEDPYEPSDEFFEVLGSFPKIDRLSVNLRNNSDLRAVCKRPLKSIFFYKAEGIDDLSPLIGLPLEGIHTNLDLSLYKEVLKKIPTLETINGMARDDFFAEN